MPCDFLPILRYNIKMEKFKEWRDEQAEKLKSISDHQQRRKRLNTIRKKEEYQTSSDLKQIERNPVQGKENAKLLLREALDTENIDLADTILSLYESNPQIVAEDEEFLEAAEDLFIEYMAAGEIDLAADLKDKLGLKAIEVSEGVQDQLKEEIVGYLLEVEAIDIVWSIIKRFELKFDVINDEEIRGAAAGAIMSSLSDELKFFTALDIQKLFHIDLSEYEGMKETVLDATKYLISIGNIKDLSDFAKEFNLSKEEILQNVSLAEIDELIIPNLEKGNIEKVLNIVTYTGWKPKILESDVVKNYIKEKIRNN